MFTFRPLLLEYKRKSPLVATVLDWDLRMEVESREATFVMELIDNLLGATFGNNVFGSQAWPTVINKTILGGEFYSYLSEGLFFCDECESFLFGKLGRAKTFSSELESLLVRCVFAFSS
jgi:hypothetical protein